MERMSLSVSPVQSQGGKILGDFSSTEKSWATQTPFVRDEVVNARNMATVTNQPQPQMESVESLKRRSVEDTRKGLFSLLSIPTKDTCHTANVSHRDPDQTISTTPSMTKDLTKVNIIVNPASRQLDHVIPDQQLQTDCNSRREILSRSTSSNVFTDVRGHDITPVSEQRLGLTLYEGGQSDVVYRPLCGNTPNRHNRSIIVSPKRTQSTGNMSDHLQPHQDLWDPHTYFIRKVFQIPKDQRAILDSQDSWHHLVPSNAEEGSGAVHFSDRSAANNQEEPDEHHSEISWSPSEHESQPGTPPSHETDVECDGTKTYEENDEAMALNAASENVTESPETLFDPPSLGSKECYPDLPGSPLPNFKSVLSVKTVDLVNDSAHTIPKRDTFIPNFSSSAPEEELEIDVPKALDNRAEQFLEAISDYESVESDRCPVPWASTGHGGLSPQIERTPYSHFRHEVKSTAEHGLRSLSDLSKETHALSYVASTFSSDLVIPGTFDTENPPTANRDENMRTVDEDPFTTSGKSTAKTSQQTDLLATELDYFRAEKALGDCLQEDDNYHHSRIEVNSSPSLSLSSSQDNVPAATISDSNDIGNAGKPGMSQWSALHNAPSGPLPVLQSTSPKVCEESRKDRSTSTSSVKAARRSSVTFSKQHFAGERRKFGFSQEDHPIVDTMEMVKANRHRFLQALDDTRDNCADEFDPASPTLPNSMENNDSPSIQKSSNIVERSMDWKPKDSPTDARSATLESQQPNPQEGTPEQCSMKEVNDPANIIFDDFNHAYPSYRQSSKNFVRACIYLDWLVSAKIAPHPCLWDDFIRAFSTDYSYYVKDCRTLEEKPMTCIDFYNGKIMEPIFTKRILSPQKLPNVLLVEPEETARLREVFRRKSLGRSEKYFGTSPMTDDVEHSYDHYSSQGNNAGLAELDRPQQLAADVTTGGAPVIDEAENGSVKSNSPHIDVPRSVHKRPFFETPSQVAASDSKRKKVTSLDPESTQPSDVTRELTTRTQVSPILDKASTYEKTAIGHGSDGSSKNRPRVSLDSRMLPVLRELARNYVPRRKRKSGPSALG